MPLSEFAKPYYSPAEIAAVLIDSGYKAEMEQLESGRTVIRSSTSGYRFSIYLYGPKDQREHVTTIQFRSSFTDRVSLESVNRWNSDKRFVKAYSDQDGELALEWDVVVKFVAPAYFKECVEWWDVLLGDLKDFLAR